MDGGAKRIHQDFTVGLLIETDPHHVHFAVDAELAASKAQCRPPLARPGLRDDAFYASLLIIICLRNSCIGFVRAAWAAPFILVVDLTVGVECLFQVAGPD